MKIGRWLILVGLLAFSTCSYKQNGGGGAPVTNNYYQGDGQEPDPGVAQAEPLTPEEEMAQTAAQAQAEAEQDLISRDVYSVDYLNSIGSALEMSRAELQTFLACRAATIYRETELVVDQAQKNPANQTERLESVEAVLLSKLDILHDNLDDVVGSRTFFSHDAANADAIRAINTDMIAVYMLLNELTADPPKIPVCQQRTKNLLKQSENVLSTSRDRFEGTTVVPEVAR